MRENSNGTSIALYRKYRPQTFEDVLGQEHIVKALKGALKEGNVSHAYLFAGSRGIGKTTVARILASEIGTTDKDLYEMDAASHTGVEDIRDIREAVSTMPFESEYKVYIIDEVHMLSRSAFNALLKTLEEPPRHVVFILATTEMHRLPDTVISRCEVHQFKKPTRMALNKHILDVAKKEGYTLEPASGELIALMAEGSFRDAQGILQKVIGSSDDKKIHVEEVATIVGAPKGELVNMVLEALSTGEAGKGLEAIGKAVENGVDVAVLVKLILEKLRAVLLLRYARDSKEMLGEEFSSDDFTFLEGLAKNTNSRIDSTTLSEMLHTYTLLGSSYIPQLPLELAIVKLAGEEE